MKFSRLLSDLFYPNDLKCVVCDAELPKKTRYNVCDKCQLSYNVKFCQRCGRPIANMAEYCDYCKENKFSFEKARSAFVYEDEVRRLVHKLKYGNAKYLGGTMAQFMADVYYESDFGVDVITYVPMHPKAEKERGYNQAKVLADELSKILAIPVETLLFRQKYTPHLAKMSKEERALAITDAYAVMPVESIKNKKILLVDDVFTTGATTNECAKVLKKAKADEIFVLTFASGKLKPLLY